MVEMEFIIDARDDPMAAIRAAKTRPRRPSGISDISDPYVLSDTASSDSLSIMPFCAKYSAAIPGITTITGISSFRKAAKTVKKIAPGMFCK